MTELDPGDTVPVPRVLVEALREAADSQRQARKVGSSHAADWALTKAARALVDAADSPPVDEPQTEPLCVDCDHTEDMHNICHFDHNECLCGCRRFTPPAPSPSTREDDECVRRARERGHADDCDCDWCCFGTVQSGATREPVPTQLTDEEAERLHSAAWERFGKMPSSNPGDFVHALIPVFESLLAARLSASTDREADAWDEGHKTGSTDCARFLGWATSEVPDARPKDRTNPYRRNP